MVTDEREIQLRADEQEGDGEVFLGDVPEDGAGKDFGPLHTLLWQAGAKIDPLLLPHWTPEQVDEASEWARAQISAHAADEPGRHTSVKWPEHVSEAHHASAEGGYDGLIGQPDADVEVDVADLPSAPEAFAQAINELDAEKAGDAARPQYQPSIPGILPAFDWRRAQLLTESLEENCASTERAWESAKKEAADAKKDYDESVDALREHIQQTHRARIDAEYQQRQPDAQAPADVVSASACAFERTTGKPCPICRNPVEGITPADNTILAHVAAGAVVSQANDLLEASGLRAVIRELSGVELHEDTVRGWSAVERAQVLAHLENSDVERPPQLGSPHEAADPAGSKQACRVCGAPMPFLPEGDEKTWPIGQKVGTDCAGEPGIDAEPTRTVKPRHAKKVDRQKAKQAGGDIAAEQKAEGKKKSAAKPKARKP